MKKASRRVAILALFTAFSLILSYIEFLLPLTYGYGLKLGLANITVLSVLYVFSLKEAMVINLLRIFINGILFGNVLSLLFSLSGGILSLLAMFLAKRFRLFSIITVSIIGALFHNIGQLIAAYLVTDIPGLFFYLPVLLIGGIITGLFIGFISKFIIKVLKEIVKNDSIFER